MQSDDEAEVVESAHEAGACKLPDGTSYMGQLMHGAPVSVCVYVCMCVCMCVCVRVSFPMAPRTWVS